MAKVSLEQPGLANEFGATPARAAGAALAQICGDFDIRIARDGTWHYRGSPIGRKELVRLFATVLTRDAAGEYWLATPYERGRIRVDDAPFIAVEVTAEGEGSHQTLVFRTNLDERVTAGPEHPIRLGATVTAGAPSPYIEVRPGLDALILRPVYYELVSLGTAETRDGGEVLGVWSGGRFFPLGRLDAE